MQQQQQLHGEKANVGPVSDTQNELHGNKANAQSAETALVIRSPFLRFPAELRNRVYDLLAKDSTDVVHAPYLSQASDTTSAERMLQDIGITQVCSQLRSEYRPLWLGKVTVRATLPTLRRLIDEYLEPNEKTRDIAVLQVQLTENDFEQGIEISAMTLFHARFPTTKLHVLPPASLMPGKMCTFCMLKVRDDNQPETEARASKEYCACKNIENHSFVWPTQARRVKEQIEILRQLVINSNKTWVELVRQHRIKVRVTGISNNERDTSKLPMEDVLFDVTCKSWITPPQTDEPHIDALDTKAGIASLLKDLGLGTVCRRYFEHKVGNNVVRYFSVVHSTEEPHVYWFIRKDAGPLPRSDDPTARISTRGLHRFQ